MAMVESQGDDAKAVGMSEKVTFNPALSFEFLYTCFTVAELAEAAPLVQPFLPGTRRHIERLFEQLAVNDVSREKLRSFYAEYRIVPKALLRWLEQNGINVETDVSKREVAEALGNVFTEIAQDHAGRSALAFSEMILKARPSASALLGRSALMSLVSSFELLLRRSLLEFFCLRPQELQSEEDKKFTLAEIVQAGSVEALQTECAERAIDRLLRENVDAWSKWFKNKRCIGRSWAELVSEWDDTREVFFRRHLVVHTGGVVTGHYVNATGRGQVNDVLDTDTAYIKCSVRLLCKLGLLASWSLARVAEKSARTKAIDELTVADATLQLIVDELAEAGWWDVVEEISGRLSNEASEHVGRLNFFVMKNLAIKRLQGNDVIRGWLQSWDVTALDEEWKFNKAVLLDDMESAFKLLPEVISRKAVTPTKLWASPLYEELRSDNRFIDIGPPKPKPVVQLPKPPNLWR